MTELRLGINTCFTATRWPNPDDKFRIVRELGLREVQYSLDAFDPALPAAYRDRLYASIRAAAEKHGVAIHSTFTSGGHHFDNLLFHPDPEWREQAFQWFSEAIRLTALVGGQGAGGFVGALAVPDMASADIAGQRRRDCIEALVRLTRVARQHGNRFFLVEPMSVKREPPSTIREALELLDEVNARAEVPIRLCLDVGHCRAVAAPSADDRDPYAWLRQCGRFAPAVHVHQTDRRASRHWPFTEEHNAQGIVEGRKVLEALGVSGAEEVVLLIELFFAPFEPADDRVLEDLRTSVAYWRQFV
jgi:D-erythrulose 1-phosphate 3-epimerase